MFRILMLFILLMASETTAQGLTPNIEFRAKAAYQQGDFETAFTALSEIPGLLGVIPILDEPQSTRRAEIFFDLARIRLAQGDTANARTILIYVHRIDPNVRSGVLDLPPDQASGETLQRLALLRKLSRQKELTETTALGAAGRSLILPGWGQLYRGHKKRGALFLGATVAAGLYWFIADRSYQNAYNDYRKTQISELDVSQRQGLPSDPFPFQQRFLRAESKASRANMALGILAGVWLAGVFDHVVVGPAQLHIDVPIF